jgi:hypothetical protein
MFLILGSCCLSFRWLVGSLFVFLVFALLIAFAPPLLFSFCVADRVLWACALFRLISCLIQIALFFVLVVHRTPHLSCNPTEESRNIRDLFEIEGMDT